MIMNKEKKQAVWIRLLIPKEIHYKHHFKAKEQGKTIHDYYIELIKKAKV